MYICEVSAFDALLAALRSRGYELIGPTVRDGAIVYDHIDSSTDLPCGVTDEQTAGHYRLKPRHDNALFGYSVGPHSWKQFLFPPSTRLWSAQRSPSEMTIDSTAEPAPKRALIGVRPCELAALDIQDRVFCGGDFKDPHYAAHRENLFILAANCTEPGHTCFCTSMGTGPQAVTHFDLAVTEMPDGVTHDFVIEVGSALGAEVLADIPHRQANSGEAEAATTAVQDAAGRMGRQLDTAGIKELLYANHDHPRWSAVAEQCLACANCTMVCPTCFCSRVEDVTDLAGDHAERWRHWDSCFNLDFSYIHGGSVRPSISSRYRQWLTHKMASWQDQFDTLGCVGCGRCITWCPVGIDLTDEVRGIRSEDARRTRETNHG